MTELFQCPRCCAMVEMPEGADSANCSCGETVWRELDCDRAEKARETSG